MIVSPAKENVIQGLEQGKHQLIYTQMIADLETPITASLKLRQPGRPFFLLESVKGGEKRERYSLLGMEPDIIWKAEDGSSKISRNGSAYENLGEDILGSFRAIQAESKLDIPEALPPLSCGLIGYMSYDMIRLIETLPDNNPDVIGIPQAYFMRPTVLLVFDSVTTSIYITSPIWVKEGMDPEQAYMEAEQRIAKVMDTLSKPLSQQPVKEVKQDQFVFNSNFTQQEYYDLVEKAKEYIVAGDIFQVVPSQRFETDFPYSSFAFYRSLRHLNPSPFLFCLDCEDFSLVGSSPEILVRLRGDEVTIRPLAGTRKRGKDALEDEALAKDLLTDEKEIAEHLMLIDLSRNDVGKVCQKGTVEVSEYMIIEYYSHVMHISSNVHGKLDPQYDAIDALFAGMPVGTVSGAPKIRAMEIIDELENVRRSFYAGCVGYFAANGDMDTCITLRTGLIKDGKLYLQAGGGVVADSDKEAEYQETLNKAKALMRAAEETAKFEVE